MSQDRFREFFIHKDHGEVTSSRLEKSLPESYKNNCYYVIETAALAELMEIVTRCENQLESYSCLSDQEVNRLQDLLSDIEAFKQKLGRSE